VTTDCPCPQRPGRTITNPETHSAFHELVIAQGGPAGLVNAETLQAARGISGGTVGSLPYRRVA
jgi:hypothetical protein